MHMKKILALLLFLSLASLLSADVLSVRYDEDLLYSAILKNNTDLRNAERDIYDSSLDVKDAKAKYQPDVDLTLSGTYMFEPPLGNITLSSDEILSQMGIPSGSGYQNGSFVTLYDGMDNTLYNAQITMTQPINTWGKIDLAVDLYETVESIQRIKKSDLERQLYTELMTRLYLFDCLNEVESLLIQAKEIASELIVIAEKSYMAGMILELEYLSAKIDMMELDLNISSVKSEIDSNIQALRKLTGLSDLQREEISYKRDDSILYTYKDVPLEELRMKALSTSNLSLEMASRLKSVHLIQEKIASRSMYGIPDMAIQVSAGYSTPRFPVLEAGWRQNDSFTLNITFAMQTTLWDGGDKITEKKRAESSQIRDDISYESASQTIDGLLNENYMAMSSGLVKLDYYMLKDANLESQMKNTALQADYGQKGKSDILKSRLDIITNKVEETTAKASIAANIYMISYLASN